MRSRGTKIADIGIIVVAADEGLKRQSIEAIELAQKEKPDLILLDILMPEMSGGDVAQVLLNNPETKNIPIIFITAIVTKDEIGPETIKKIGGRNV